jgi:hypothetical protein
MKRKVKNMVNVVEYCKPIVPLTHAALSFLLAALGGRLYLYFLKEKIKDAAPSLTQTTIK